MRNDSVMICFTCNGKVDKVWATSMFQFGRYDLRNRNVLYEYPMLDVAGDYMFCRNAIPREFLKHGCEWMWFVDTDHRIPVDTLYKLLDAADPVERPIVAALQFNYIAEWPHPVPAWFEKLSSGEYRTVSTFGPDLQKIDAFAMGCHIVHRGALETIYEAHKDDEWSWYGRDLIYVDVSTEADHHMGLDMIEPKRLGDDLTFGLRCEKLGIPIYGHGGARIGHNNKSREENVETWEIGNQQVVVEATLKRLAAKKAQEAKFYATVEGQRSRNDLREYQGDARERAPSEGVRGGSTESGAQVWCPYLEEESQAQGAQGS